MNRRQLIKAGLAWPLTFADRAVAGNPVFIADMHYHLFFDARGTLKSGSLAKTMADGNATLVAWALVGDLLWMTPTPRGYAQKSVPKPGETLGWLQRELARIKAQLKEQNLEVVSGPDDIELALKGQPRIVL